jgi:hypothetical protein
VKLFSVQRRRETAKPLQFLELMKGKVLLWRKYKAAISGCKVSQKKFTGPKKGQFPEIDDVVFTFFQERHKIGLFVSYDLLRDEQ